MSLHHDTHYPLHVSASLPSQPQAAETRVSLHLPREDLVASMDRCHTMGCHMSPDNGVRSTSIKSISKLVLLHEVLVDVSLSIMRILSILEKIWIPAFTLICYDVLTIVTSTSASSKAVLAFKRPRISARTATTTTYSVVSTTSKENSSVGPIGLLPGGVGIDFKWKAWLNGSSGLAGSVETSRLKVLSNTQKQEQEEQQKWYKNAQYQQKLHSLSHNLISSWSDFLCKGSVSLGLFQTQPVSKESTLYLNVGKKRKYEISRRDDAYGSSIHPRWIPPLHLLTFGKPKRIPTSWNGWEIPIEGGLLSLENQNGRRGKLVFEIIKKQREGNDNNKSNNNPENGDSMIYQLKSQIVDYTPRISGNAPVPVLRQWFYLHSQSLVHAYVTWRFHRVWQQKVEDLHNEFVSSSSSSSSDSS